MSRFAQYLLQRNHLTRDQLEEAVQHQAVYGARLGTNLVELKLLSIEDLAEQLSEFHHIPLPPRQWLERPRRAAVKRVTRPLVERIRFIPLQLEGNLLHAAVLDPNDPNVLDNLRFATGCRIKPYVLPEIWMHDWLLALFKVPRGIRHIETDSGPEREVEGVKQAFDFEAAQATIAAKTEHGAASASPKLAVIVSPAAVESASGAQKPPERARASVPHPISLPFSAQAFSAHAFPATAAVPPGASVRPPAIPVRSLADLGGDRFTLEGFPANIVPDFGRDFSSPWDSDLVLDPDGPSHSSDGPEITIEPGPEPIESTPSGASAPASRELRDLEHALMQVGDREQLIELSFAIATRLASMVALFIVHRGMVQGVRCIEQNEVRPIDGVLLPLEAASMLTQAATAMQPTRANPGERSLDARVLQLLGDEGAAEVGLFPVTIKQRSVNLLYASNRAEPLGPIAFAALEALAEQMGAAYGRLILSKKGAAAHA